MCEFKYADKQNIENILPHLFNIFYSNMSVIAPIGNTYENDLNDWLSNIVPAMQKEPRQIVLMLDDNEVIGYFQYYINSKSLMMEEIQIKKEYQCTGLFQRFYAWLIQKLPKNMETVEAYSNKSNYKSQHILEHLGLTKLEEKDNFLYYKGDYKKILEKYNN